MQTEVCTPTLLGKFFITCYLLLVIHLCVILSCGYAAEPPQSGSETPNLSDNRVLPDDFFIKPGSVSIEKDTIKITGATNLPDQSIITILAYYTAYNREKLIDIMKAVVKDGSWAVEFGPFGKIPSGKYKFIIEFDPHLGQYKEVREILGPNAQPLKQTIHKQSGTPEDVEKERLGLLNNIKQSTKNLHHLYLDLKEQFHNSIKSQEKWDKALWQNWLKQYHSEIERLIKFATRQDPLRVFRSVFEAEMQMENLAARLKRSGKLCDKALTDPKRDSAQGYEDIIKELDNLNTQFEQVLDKLGLAQPLDKTGLADTIKELESLLDTLEVRLKANIKQGTVEENYPSWLIQRQTQANRLVLNLSTRLSSSAYAKVSEISHQVLNLMKCLEKDKKWDKSRLDKFQTVQKALQKNLNAIKSTYALDSK